MLWKGFETKLVLQDWKGRIRRKVPQYRPHSFLKYQQHIQGSSSADVRREGRLGFPSRQIVNTTLKHTLQRSVRGERQFRDRNVVSRERLFREVALRGHFERKRRELPSLRERNDRVRGSKFTFEKMVESFHRSINRYIPSLRNATDLRVGDAKKN